jgi:CHAT domain-containing protein
MRARGRHIPLPWPVVSLSLLLGSLAADEPSPNAESPKPAAFTQQQQVRLREADRLVKEANALLAAGKQNESAAAAEKALAIRRDVLGAENEQVVLLLQSLARQHERIGNREAAGKHLEEVLTIREKRFGKDHWHATDARLALAELQRRAALTADQRRKLDDADRLSREAVTLYKQKGAAAAIAPAVQACDAYEATLGERSPRYITSLNTLAGLYHATTNYAKALPLYVRIRDLRKAVQGERHPDYATSLDHLGRAYQATADYAKALPLLVEALDVQKAVRGERPSDYANGLNNLAHLYGQMGEFAKALPLLIEAREVWKAARGERDADYITSVNNLAGMYQQMGDFSRALPLFLESRDLSKQALGERDGHYINSLGNLAGLYMETGEYAKALPLFLEVRDAYKATMGERHPVYAIGLNNLASIYRKMGDNEKALPLLIEARDVRKAVLGPRHPDYAVSVHNLALAYHDMGNLSKALQLLQEARDVRKATLGAHHPDYANSLSNLAGLYRDMGEEAKALPLYLEALDILKGVKGERRPQYSRTLNSLAWLYRDMGEPAKALPLIVEARDLTKAAMGEHQPHYLETVQNLACACYSTGDVGQAKALYRESYALARETLERTAGAQAERQQVLMAASMRSMLDCYLSLLVATHQPATEAYAAVLDAKGAVLARKKWDQLASASDPETAHLGEKLRTVSSQLAAHSLAAPPSPQQRAWRQELRSLEEQRERLEQQLAAHSAPFRADRARRRATTEQVGDALPDGAALVDFFEYKHYAPPAGGKGKWPSERRLLAFVLRPHQLPVLVELGTVAPVAKAVTDWRGPMESSSLAPVDDTAARTLSRLAWRPLLPHLEGATTLLISPDGALCSFPFAALPGEKPGSYLIEERAVGYLPSARSVLGVGGEKQLVAGGLLGVGDVDYGKRPTTPPAPGVRRAFYAPLPGTRPELERVAAAYRAAFPDGNASRLLTGAAPDAAAIKRELTRSADKSAYRFVHLACHGFFDPIPPAPSPDPTGGDLFASPGPESGPHLLNAAIRDPLLRSGLALAGVNRAPEAGTLTAAEVAGLDLRGCELAVLSACQTGLGSITNGEGVLGLQRAFDQAGARTLIASLWSVNDAGTSLLMEEFYTNVWAKKLPKLEALRQAQLTVLRHPEQVAKRAQQLRGELAQRGVPNDLLASRGFDRKEEELASGERPKEADRPKEKATPSRRSHPALWAAFVLSGEYR